MLSYQLVHDHDFLIETMDGCNNHGAACYTCPNHDACMPEEDEEYDHV